MQLLEQDFETIRKYIFDTCALEITKNKQYLIESRLSPIMHEIGCTSYSDFFKKLQSNHSPELKNKFIDAITTHETLWFRDSAPWKILEEVVLPKFADDLKSRKKSKIRIWSAACSTGQELYSLTMLIDKLITSGKLSGIRPEQFELLGTDISKPSVDKAIAGKFNSLEMKRGLPATFAQKYFTPEGRYSVINDNIKKRVSFRPFNLKDNFLSIGRMDLILCRNVLIYFSDEFKNQLIRRFAMNMNPGAFFILGSTESGLGHTHTFDIKNHNSAIYYQLKEL